MPAAGKLVEVQVRFTDRLADVPDDAQRSERALVEPLPVPAHARGPALSLPHPAARGGWLPIRDERLPNARGRGEGQMTSEDWRPTRGDRVLSHAPRAPHVRQRDVDHRRLHRARRLVVRGAADRQRRHREQQRARRRRAQPHRSASGTSSATRSADGASASRGSVACREREMPTSSRHERSGSPAQVSHRDVPDRRCLRRDNVAPARFVRHGRRSNARTPVVPPDLAGDCRLTASCGRR